MGVGLEPSGVAGGQRGRRETVGEDREADGQIDRKQDQMLLGELRLLDEDHGEDDRCVAAGPNQPRKPSVGRRAPEPTIAIATGSMRTNVRLRTA